MTGAGHSSPERATPRDDTPGHPAMGAAAISLGIAP
jgi:hypothetical protein